MAGLLGLLNRMNTRRGIPMGDFLSAFVTGDNVDPRGGTYKTFDEPLIAQYQPSAREYVIPNELIQDLMTPSILRMMYEQQQLAADEQLDENWGKDKFNWPLRGVGGLGTQIGR